MGLLLDLVRVLADFANAAPSLPAFVVLFAALWVPALVVHELGHAFTMRRVYGGHVDVLLGRGEPWLVGTVGQIHFQVSRSPWHGLARAKGPHLTRVGLSGHLSVVLAGPAASLVASLLSATWLSVTTGGSAAHAVAWMATLVNVAICVGCLVPYEYVSRSGGRMHTDGALALRLLSVKRTGRVPERMPVVSEGRPDRDAKRRLAWIVAVGSVAVVLSLVWYVQVAVPR